MRIVYLVGMLALLAVLIAFTLDWFAGQSAAWPVALAAAALGLLGIRLGWRWLFKNN